jgi:hypothetical protein
MAYHNIQVNLLIYYDTAKTKVYIILTLRQNTFPKKQMR